MPRYHVRRNGCSYEEDIYIDGVENIGILGVDGRVVIFVDADENPLYVISSDELIDAVMEDGVIRNTEA